MEKLKVKEEEQPPKQVPLRAIICPNCKHKNYGNKFLYNKQLNYTVCPECGIMFMNSVVVKGILKQINSSVQAFKSVEAK